MNFDEIWHGSPKIATNNVPRSLSF